MSDKAKTVEDVIAQFAEAEEINPVWERVTVFSWNDLLLLKNSIATVIIHIKPKFVNRLMVLISIRAKAKGLYSLIISAINSGDSQPQSQWCAFAMRAGL